MSTFFIIMTYIILMHNDLTYSDIFDVYVLLLFIIMTYIILIDNDLTYVYLHIFL